MVLDCTGKLPKLKYFIDGKHEKYANFNGIKGYNSINCNDNVYTLCISLNTSEEIEIMLETFTATY